jgi:GntR family transcriptional regulator
VDGIESGKIRVGSRLPSEADLEREYGVSRTTARRALDELRRQGFVRREPGRGTFLTSPRLRSDLSYLYGFSEEIERLGSRPGARLIEQEETTADEETATRLQLPPGEKVLYVRRLRLADEKPIFMCDSYLPITRFPVLREADYSAVSLSRLFRETVGRGVERAQQWIQATIPAPDVAALLDVPAGTPVLLVKRVSFVTDNKPIEFVEAFFHPDRYRYYNEFSVKPVEMSG